MDVSSWSRYRALSLHRTDLGVAVDLSQMSLEDDALSRDPLLSRGLPEAIAAMEALERGALANPDENRMVGHYWLRAPQLAPDPAIRAVIEGTVAKVQSFAGDVVRGRIAPPKSARFRNLLVIGTGASVLGLQFLADALRGTADRLRPFFIDNTDPDGMVRELSRIGASGGLATTLTVVVSRSGEAAETRIGTLVAKEAYRRTGLDFGRQAVAITEGRSELDAVAVREHWLARFPVWDWVYAPTSLTSAVGLLPAALLGIDVAAFLAGAATMDEATREKAPARNPAALLALAWHQETEGKGRKVMAVLPYKDRLQLFPPYLQQLVMESLGKGTDLSGRPVEQGIIVWGGKGSTGQHAWLQQLRDGIANTFVTFIEVARNLEETDEPSPTGPDAMPAHTLLGYLHGARQVLSEKGRPSLTITLPDVSPRSVGMLVALFERTVGLYASLVEVNAYNRPAALAVGKAAAGVLDLVQKVLAELRAKTGHLRTAGEIAAAIGAEAETGTVYRLLCHLAANQELGPERREGQTPCDALFGFA